MKCFAVGYSHATFCRGDDFDGVEAENRDVTEVTAANRAATVSPTDGMRGVFYNGKPILDGQSMNGGHVTGLAAEVNGHNDFGELSGEFRRFKLSRQRIRA
jgi:hypothetical protein